LSAARALTATPRDRLPGWIESAQLGVGLGRRNDNRPPIHLSGMKAMRKSLMLAASIATLFVLANVNRPAVAQDQPGAATSTAKPKAAKKAAKAAPRRAAAKARTKKAAAKGYLPRGAKGPGRCGTFMYWKGGKCVDARLPSK